MRRSATCSASASEPPPSILTSRIRCFRPGRSLVLPQPTCVNGQHGLRSRHCATHRPPGRTGPARRQRRPRERQLRLPPRAARRLPCPCPGPALRMTPCMPWPVRFRDARPLSPSDLPAPLDDLRRVSGPLSGRQAQPGGGNPHATRGRPCLRPPRPGCAACRRAPARPRSNTAQSIGSAATRRNDTSEKASECHLERLIVCQSGFSVTNVMIRQFVSRAGKYPVRSPIASIPICLSCRLWVNSLTSRPTGRRLSVRQEMVK